MTVANPALTPFQEPDAPPRSRRQALATIFAGALLIPRTLSGADPDAPIRLAISDSLVADVNLNDARAAMLIWIKRISRELNVVIDYDARVFNTTKEIFDRVRGGVLDAVAVNAVEYWQIADLMDPKQIVVQAGAAGLVQYAILARKSAGIAQLVDLRGRRLTVLKAPGMCVADAWLTTILSDGNLGPVGPFFGSVTSDTRPFQVVLPVFFGKADACVTTTQAFETICELNPQVAKDLVVVARSPAMVVNLYAFRRNFPVVRRERLINALSSLSSNQAGRQLAMLFHFEELVARDGGCMADSLALIERAERLRRQSAAKVKV